VCVCVCVRVCAGWCVDGCSERLSWPVFTDRMRRITAQVKGVDVYCLEADIDGIGRRLKHMERKLLYLTQQTVAFFAHQTAAKNRPPKILPLPPDDLIPPLVAPYAHPMPHRSAIPSESASDDEGRDKEGEAEEGGDMDAGRRATMRLPAAEGDEQRPPVGERQLADHPSVHRASVSDSPTAQFPSSPFFPSKAPRQLLSVPGPPLVSEPPSVMDMDSEEGLAEEGEGLDEWDYTTVSIDRVADGARTCISTTCCT